MVKLSLLCGFLPGLWFLRKRKQTDNQSISSSRKSLKNEISTDPTDSDPGLLKKHSTHESYTVPETGYTYPSIRTFYRPHPQGSKLPSEPYPMPLLVFIHGLGGSVAQFHPLLVSLVNLSPCLAIDLPGCGLSKFEPTDWNAYTTECLVRLLAVAIERYRDAEANQQVILIGHSMGCTLSALLASATSPYANLISEHVIGAVAICPPAEPPKEKQAAQFRKLLAIPGPIFNLWRRWDRRGGTESASVARFVGANPEPETKKLQYRFNEQSRTPVWRRMARGMLPNVKTKRGGMAGKEVWGGLKVPLYLIAGESDPVTPPGEVQKIVVFLGRSPTKQMPSTQSMPPPDSAAPVDTGIDRKLSDTTTDSRHDSAMGSTGTPSPVIPSMESVPSNPKQPPLKTTILPAPASHALLYAPTTSRTIAGLISTFLSAHLDKRLSLGWQLQYLCTEGKWDVKNLAKWQAVQPVSEPIAGIFRAMKTLREVDEQHSPAVFVQEWGWKVKKKDGLAVVVDISHESPVYDPKGLEAGGIGYRKFPTVSKLPPSLEEVLDFCNLIDELRSNLLSTARALPEGQEQEPGVESGESGKPLIGVHCHYGFNRTGFFICSYLIERMGYRLQDAIEEFKEKRPPGIRHEHFIDALYVRYGMNLKRAPTL